MFKKDTKGIHNMQELPRHIITLDGWQDVVEGTTESPDTAGRRIPTRFAVSFQKGHMCNWYNIHHLLQIQTNAKNDANRYAQPSSESSALWISLPTFRYQGKFLQIPELLCDGTTATMLANSSPNVKPECVVAHTIFFLFPVAMLESNEYLMLFDIY